MAKYSFELKLQVIQDYIGGKGGYEFLAKKYSVKSVSSIKDWVYSYQKFGAEGLLRKRKNEVYTVQFKLDAIELYQTSELSYRELSNTLGLNNPSMIVNWMRQFREKGIEGLSAPKGRPSTMPKKKNEEKSKKQVQTVISSTTDKERIKELETQVRSLQIQNAFLKELRKLRKQEARERIKQSQKSSPASEDNSN